MPIFRVLALSLSLCASGVSLAAGESIPSVNQSAFDHSHTAWTHILKEHVRVSGSKSTFVYSALKKDSAALSSYLTKIAAVSTHDFSDFSADKKLAFLINAYNAFTVKLIIENYPIKSIKDLGGLFSNPWKKKFFKLFGEDRSLDDIEHEMIRKQFKEPRIHFALVCASTSCPPLRAEAFSHDKLNKQLDEQTRLFISDKDRNFYNASLSTLFLSSIFKWYGTDFEKKSGSVKAFVTPYLASLPEEQKKLQSSNIPITFLDYNWSLNETKD